MQRVLMIVALAALAAGCASLSGGEGRRDAAPGQRFAQRACAGCHALGPEGVSRNPHAPPFRTLAARLPGPALEAQLGAIARDGHVEMPPIYMTPGEIHDVAAYIRAVAAPDAAYGKTLRGSYRISRREVCTYIPAHRGAAARALQEAATTGCLS